jgi:hypothetical protein
LPWDKGACDFHIIHCSNIIVIDFIKI